MSVKLKVLHGALKKSGKFQIVVGVKRSPFLIGQAEDCNMRCYGATTSRYHCHLRVAGFEIFVRDLQSQHGTFVNDERIEGERAIWTGDRLRVGRLEFELIVEVPSKNARCDPFGDYVSGWLLEADEADRQSRADDPMSRWYQIEPVDPYEGLTKKEKILKKAREKLPPQQDGPKKLPKKTYANVDAAVDESLKQYFRGLEARIHVR